MAVALMDSTHEWLYSPKAVNKKSEHALSWFGSEGEADLSSAGFDAFFV